LILPGASPRAVRTLAWDAPAVRPDASNAQHRTTWEPPRARAVRAAWTLGGGRCYSLASASADSSLAHPLSSSRNVSRFEAEHLCPAASLDVLDADPPRALFSCRRWESLRALRPHLWRLLSPSGTGDRLLPRPPATAPRAALVRVGSASPKDQNRPAVPSRRGAISSRARRWRNDSRRLPSCRTPCLPPQDHAAFHPRVPGASRRRTESCVVPSL